uniref:Secreted protein n=1 Tax=Amphiprion percula TaxID=161767 RepID=A0A3P8RQR8_AMPPE
MVTFLTVVPALFRSLTSSTCPLFKSSSFTYTPPDHSDPCAFIDSVSIWTLVEGIQLIHLIQSLSVQTGHLA